MDQEVFEPVGDLHIDDFCRDAAKVLLLLYRRFPVKTTLYVEDISGPDQPDEFGLHSPRFEACFGTLVWLHDADYISYSTTVKQEAVEDACLTHRAFCLLSSFSQEELIAGSPSRRIDLLKKALKSSNSEALKSQVLSLMMQSRDYK